MLIGLYDYDLLEYGSTYFNLELMKISSYYKQKGDIVVLAPKLEPRRYSKFFVRKDFKNNDYDKAIFEDNVTRGGLAFSYQYEPMGDEIEFIKPDVHLYDKVSSKFDHTTLIRLKQSWHLRLSQNQESVFEKNIKTLLENKKNRYIYLHDSKIGEIKDAELFIKELLNKVQKTNRFKKKLMTKFPIIINNQEDIEKWKDIPLESNTFVQLNTMFSDEFLNYFIKDPSFIQLRKNFLYNPCGNVVNVNDFLKDNLPKIFSQVLFCRSRLKPVTLIYDNSFLEELKLKYLFHAFSTYQTQSVNFVGQTYIEKDYFTFYNYFTILKNISNLEKRFMRDVANYVREVSYETFKMFYENGYANYKGGKIDVE